MKCWRVLLADDHDIIIEGLRRILDQPGFQIVGTAKDGLSFNEALARAAAGTC